MIESTTSAYLSTGILERFALDMLVGDEFAEVEDLLTTNLEIGEELEKIYCAIDAIEVILASRPKFDLRTRIFEALEHQALSCQLTLVDHQLLGELSAS